MILHCAPPYRRDVPNPSVGYLKGFLEAKGVKTKNVYWDLVLFQEIQGFNRGLEIRSGGSELFSIYAIIVYVWRHLMAEDAENNLAIDPFFSSILSEEELAQIIHSIKTKIDWYINMNTMHKDPLSGFTLKTHQWLMNSYIIRRLKEMNPDIKIIIGGIFNENQARTLINVFTHADFAIWGEGEYPLYHLVTALKEGTDLNKVPQLVYRDNSTIVSTRNSNEFPNLDSYPFADHTDYFAELKRVAPDIIRPIIPIWGSRSCPWNKCKFCVSSEGLPYRTRSLENIIEEIEFQAQRHNCDSFFFVDTELPGNMKRFKALLRLLLQSSASRKEPYRFFASMSPIFTGVETTRNMSLAAFESIQIGFEAVTDTLLEKMAKRHRFAHNIQALKLGNRYRLKMDALNVIRGIPTETEEDILESCSNVRFLRFFLDFHTLIPCTFALYKGAPFYKEMSKEERKRWNYNRLWTGIASANFIPECDRFDFFGFFKEGSVHGLWDDFDMTLKFYSQQCCTYTWIEYEDGSFIEERGAKTYRYTLDRDETDVLIFCDLIKSFQEVEERFSHVSKVRILTILSDLKRAGLLYYDKEMRTIISVLDASKREPLRGS